MNTPRYCPPFTPMADVFQPTKHGDYNLDIFEMTPEIVRHEQNMAVFRGEWGEVRDLEAGRYVRLTYRYTTLMSDTPMERRTNLAFVEAALGNVLVGGLGVGMILIPLASKPTVTHITVIEKSPEVIEMISPQLLNYLGSKWNKVEIINGDVFDFPAHSGRKYESIYFDIWDYPNADAWPESKRLHKDYARIFNRRFPGAVMMSWRRDDMRRAANRMMRPR